MMSIDSLPNLDLDNLKNLDLENLDFDSDNLDTAEFWKNRDETTKLEMNEKLLRIARNGPSSEFVSILEQEPSSSLSSSLSSLNSNTYSIDLDIVDASGWSPLIHASFNGHSSIVKHILSYQEKKYLFEYEDKPIVLNDDEMKEESELKWKYLFKKFISRKVKWNGSTALHLACARGHESIVTLLVQKMVKEYKMSLDFSINAIDFDMATPLHCAVLGKHYKICKLLVLNGAIVNKTDIRGKTPLNWAKERNLNDFVSLLTNPKPNNKKSDHKSEFDDSANTAKSVVQNIWDNEERKSMESPMNEIEDEIERAFENEIENEIRHELHHEFHQGIVNEAMNTQNIHINNNQNDVNVSIPTYHSHTNHYRNTNNMVHYNQWNMNQYNNNNNNNGYYHNQHHYNHHYRVRAPRHQRYTNTMQFNHHQPRHQYQQQPPQAPLQLTASCSPPAVHKLTQNNETLVPDELKLEVSKSCPVMDKEKQKGKEDKEEVRKEDTDKDKEEKHETIHNNPSFDAMKFQNKYLKARCETLEREHKELATEYKQQLSRENNRWRLKEEKVMKQLNTKQKQIHELRHTLRRMRMFLDNLPVRMKRNFYEDNGNFSREIYENQQTVNVDVKNGSNEWKTVKLKQETKNKNKSKNNNNSKSRNNGVINDKSWRRKK